MEMDSCAAFLHRSRAPPRWAGAYLDNERYADFFWWLLMGVRWLLPVIALLLAKGSSPSLVQSSLRRRDEWHNLLQRHVASPALPGYLQRNPCSLNWPGRLINGPPTWRTRNTTGTGELGRNCWARSGIASERADKGGRRSEPMKLGRRPGAIKGKERRSPPWAGHGPTPRRSGCPGLPPPPATGHR